MLDPTTVGLIVLVFGAIVILDQIRGLVTRFRSGLGIFMIASGVLLLMPSYTFPTCIALGAGASMVGASGYEAWAREKFAVGHLTKGDGLLRQDAVWMSLCALGIAGIALATVLPLARRDLLALIGGVVLSSTVQMLFISIDEREEQ